MRHAAAEITEEQYPESLDVSGSQLPLKYRFAPEHPLDGLTLTVPLGLLNQLDTDRLSWLVPGMIREKVTWYLKALPKALRNRLTPLPDAATAFLETAPRPHASLEAALRSFVGKRLGTDLPHDVWDERALPAHLRVNLAVVDDAGRELAMGRDPAALRARLGDAAQLSFAAAAPQWDRSRIRSWDFGDLPETLAIDRDGRRLTGYPALVRHDDGIAMQLLDTRAAADEATRAAVVELIGLQLKEAWRVWEKGPTGFVQTALQLKPALAADALLRDTLAAIRARAFLGDDAIPRTEKAFAELAKRARARLPAVAESAFRLLAAIAAEYRALSQRLGGLSRGASRLGAEVAAQRDRLVYPGFMSATPWAQLSHLPRYLKALDRRLAKYPENPARDAKHAADVAELWERYRSRLERDRARGRADPALEAYRWLLEELRVSLFAQELRTPFPVSYKRLEKAWKAIAAG
jgi:ATP-dependent helicase HrpA